MAVSQPPAPGRSGATTASSDWPAEAADLIERTVLTVRDSTTGKVETAAKALVYGLFASLVGLAAGVMAAIALVRFADAYLPESVFGETHTWAAHLVIGVVFLLLAAVFVRLRRPSESDD